jgi:hypothetical protein
MGVLSGDWDLTLLPGVSETLADDPALGAAGIGDGGYLSGLPLTHRPLIFSVIFWSAIFVATARSFQGRPRAAGGISGLMFSTGWSRITGGIIGA